MSQFHRATEALNSLYNTLHLSNDDETFWWDSLSGLLAVFLAKAGYDEQL